MIHTASRTSSECLVVATDQPTDDATVVLDLGFGTAAGADRMVTVAEMWTDPAGAMEDETVQITRLMRQVNGLTPTLVLPSPKSQS